MNFGVVKVGGAILRSRAGFTAVQQWLLRQSHQRWIIVLSALGQTTRTLEQAARYAETGQRQQAIKVFHTVLHFHTQLASRLITGSILQIAQQQLADLAQQVRQLLDGVSITRELTPRTLDRILSYGEAFATVIFAALLQQTGLTYMIAPATEIIVTDNHHLAATIDFSKTIAKIRHYLTTVSSDCTVILTQGFVGRSFDGEVTTLGFEGSSITAAVLAVGVGASPLYVLTDVAGVRSADPKLVEHTALIPVLSYETAGFLGFSGLRLLHPVMVEILWQHRIQACVLTPMSAEPENTLLTTSINSPPSPIFLCLSWEEWIYREQMVFRPLHCRYPHGRTVEFEPTPDRTILICYAVKPADVLEMLPRISGEISHCMVSAEPPVTFLAVSRERAIALLQQLHSYWYGNSVAVIQTRSASYGTGSQ